MIGAASDGPAVRIAASDASLYDFHLATYDADDRFDQSLARGFVELWGLPARIAALRDERVTAPRDERVTAPRDQPGHGQGTRGGGGSGAG